MHVDVMVEKNSYYDSVTLMSLSSKIIQKEGVLDAVVSMGTPMNKELLDNVNMLTEKAQEASENDLIIAIKMENSDDFESIIEYISNELNDKNKKKKNEVNQSANTFEGALELLDSPNLAIISVPGEFAAREAKMALEKGLNVMMFSDNVSIKDELELKELAVEKNLLMMGPDCGTAIINQTGLCFSNSIRPGEIGLVAASGTGLQEVAVQIDRLGYGITQAIGTGGRDLHEEIGGLMMLKGLELLENDNNTKVITLISKPPSKSVQSKILEKVKTLTKPVVICFIDGDKESVESVGAVFSSTLLDAAHQSILMLDNQASVEKPISSELKTQINNNIYQLVEKQKNIKGLYCGGTLAAEALSILRDEVKEIKSNVAVKSEEQIGSNLNSVGSVLLDMGDDEFTKGKPHPMIEPNLRNDRILLAAQEDSTAVLLLDFEIGYGAHENPVGESLGTLIKAKKIAAADNRFLPIVAYICGTDGDKQNLATQEEKLQEIGVIVASSNEMACKIAGKIVNKEVI